MLVVAGLGVVIVGGRWARRLAGGHFGAVIKRQLGIRGRLPVAPSCSSVSSRIHASAVSTASAPCGSTSSPVAVGARAETSCSFRQCRRPFGILGLDGRLDRGRFGEPLGDGRSFVRLAVVFGSLLAGGLAVARGRRLDDVAAHDLRVPPDRGVSAVTAMAPRAAVHFVLGGALRAFLFVDQGLPVGDRDLVVRGGFR